MPPLRDSTNNKTNIMKTKITLILSAIVVSIVLASCGGGRIAHCDAYGSVQTTETSDLASK